MPIPQNVKLIDGPITLSGNFPPTLNKDQDRTKLEVNESPDCYGADWDVEGILKTGTIPTGTARVAPVGTGSYTSYNWYYNRLMKVNGSNAAQLDIGSPEYRAEFYDQDVGSRTVWANIVTFMPVLQDSLLIATATGSHLMENMRDPRGFFWLGDFEQSFFAEVANRVTTLRGIPFVCNATGIYSWDGREVTEWTRAIRNNIAPFSATAITCDYDERLVIGTDAFVLDTSNGRLFDYSTSGFRFTSRTLTQPVIEGLQPYTVSGVTFLLDVTASGTQKIEWESKLDNGNWFTEPDIKIGQKEKQITKVLSNQARKCRECTLRITSMTSGVRIREIQLMVEGLAQEAL
jgi:hypothetical protein